MCRYNKLHLQRNKDAKQNFCAGKSNAHVNNRQLNRNYCILKVEYISWSATFGIQSNSYFMY